MYLHPFSALPQAHHDEGGGSYDDAVLRLLLDDQTSNLNATEAAVTVKLNVPVICPVIDEQLEGQFSAARKPKVDHANLKGISRPCQCQCQWFDYDHAMSQLL